MADFLPLTDSLILSRVHDAVVFLDSSDRVVSANERFFTWTSFTTDQVVGHPVGEFWEDRVRWSDWLTVLRLAGAARDNEVLELKTKGGDPIPVEVHLATIPMARRRPSRVLVLHDLRPLRLLELLVHQDPLTGVASRPTLLPRLDEELVRGEAYATPTGVILLDVDGLSALNRRWGPAFGDEVLRVVGAQLRETVLAPRWAGRWGSDEFLVLVPRCPVSEVVVLAEALQRGFAGRLFVPQGVEVRVTASLGVAVAGPTSHETSANLLDRALQALNQARSWGGNRVEVSP